MKYILLKSIQLSLRIRHKAMLSFPNTSSSAKKRVCHSCLSGNQAIGKTGAVPRGGGYSKMFYTGRLRPEVRPLTLLFTIFFRKGTPFVYLLLEKGTPFIYLLKTAYE